MKIGTDGVLLGAWVNVTDVDRALDIGTGTGVIALMIAQRTEGKCKIDAVEIDDGACKDAYENFSGSPWENSLQLFQVRIQDFTERQGYKLLTANPPYFNNSLRPSDANRTTARHTENLTFEDIVESVKRLMHPKGRFGVILPPAEASQLTMLMNDAGLYLNRNWIFKSREEKPEERRLMEFSYQSGEIETGDIILYGNNDTWSESYRKITQDFYLQR